MAKDVSCFELVGKRWSALLVQDLADGPRRFRELLRHLSPINDKVLSQRLKELEAAGIINRQMFPEVPIRVEYSMMDKGLGLIAVIREMEKWDSKWANGAGHPGQNVNDPLPADNAGDAQQKGHDSTMASKTGTAGVHRLYKPVVPGLGRRRVKGVADARANTATTRVGLKKVAPVAGGSKNPNGFWKRFGL